MSTEEAHAWAAHYDEQIERDRRHQRDRRRLQAEQDARNGDRTAGLEDQATQLDGDLQATGLRKFYRDVTGRTERDRRAKDALERSVKSAAQREAEERGKLAARHQAEIDAQTARRETETADRDRGPQGPDRQQNNQRQSDTAPPSYDLELTPPGMGGVRRPIPPAPTRWQGPPPIEQDNSSLADQYASATQSPAPDRETEVAERFRNDIREASMEPSRSVGGRDQ